MTKFNDNTIGRPPKHGYARNGHRISEYHCWTEMRQRCTNPTNKHFRLYGGRGITICSRWNSFANFLADMGRKPSRKHSLDRYPNQNGNYEPGNCRWATQQQQMRNRRNNHLITFNGETLPLVEWALRIGILASTIRTRLKSGWPIALALTLSPTIGRRIQCQSDHFLLLPRSAKC